MRDKDKTKAQLINELEELRQRVAELKASETERKRAEALYRTLINRAPTAVYIAQEGKIVFVNPQYQKYTGFTRNELLSMNPLALVYPDDRQQVRENAVAMLKGNRFAPYEFRTITKSGEIIWSAGTIASVYYNGKRAALGNFVDITDRKKFEDALRQSEEMYRSLFQEANDAIFLVEEDTGYILNANREAERLMGRSSKQIIGMHQTQLHPPEKAAFYEDAFKDFVKKGHINDLEAKVIRNDGTIVPVIISASVLQLHDRKLIQAIFRDITERKRMEKRLRELYEQEKELRQELEAEMQRRIEFTRVLVHELKTPLTPVLASSELLVTQLEEEPLLTLAKNINRGASNLNNRIDELLDLARGEMGMLQLRSESVDMLQLLHGMVNDMTLVASRQGQSLLSELPPSLPSAWADEGRLRQVVLNLLSNALKFTPEGGKITLRAKQKDSALIVEVQDTGPGIAKEDQKRLFEPYHRLEGGDREHLSGLGLGLALCKTLIELHGGDIWVESGVGEGSTFGFSIPLEVARRRAKGSKARGKV